VWLSLILGLLCMPLGKHSTVELVYQLPFGDQLVYFQVHFYCSCELNSRALVHLAFDLVSTDLLFVSASL